MSKTVREKKTSKVTKPPPPDICPSLMVIPSYAELQRERTLKRIKERFNLLTHRDPCTLRSGSKTSFTQTFCSIDNGNEELAHRDMVIGSLKEKILQTEKLNKKLHKQLIESSLAHSDKDQDIANLKFELSVLHEELRKKEIFLVDYERCKKSEAQMAVKLANRHMTIVRLTEELKTRNAYVSVL